MSEAPREAPLVPVKLKYVDTWLRFVKDNDLAPWLPPSLMRIVQAVTPCLQTIEVRTHFGIATQKMLDLLVIHHADATTARTLQRLRDAQRDLQDLDLAEDVARVVQARLLKLVSALVATADILTDTKVTLPPFIDQLRTVVAAASRKTEALKPLHNWRITVSKHRPFPKVDDMMGHIMRYGVGADARDDLHALVMAAEELPWVSAEARDITVNYFRRLADGVSLWLAQKQWLHTVAETVPALHPIVQHVNYLFLHQAPDQEIKRLETLLFDAVMHMADGPAEDAWARLHEVSGAAAPPQCSDILTAFRHAMNSAIAWASFVRTLPPILDPAMAAVVRNQEGVLTKAAFPGTSHAEILQIPVLRPVKDAVQALLTGPGDEHESVAATAKVDAILRDVRRTQKAIARGDYAAPATVVLPLLYGLGRVLDTILLLVQHTQDHIAFKAAVRAALRKYETTSSLVGSLQGYIRELGEVSSILGFPFMELLEVQKRFSSKAARGGMSLEELLATKKVLQKLAVVMATHTLAGQPTYREDARPVLATIWEDMRAAIEQHLDARMSRARVGWMGAVAQAGLER